MNTILGRTAILLLLAAGFLAACRSLGADTNGCAAGYPARSHAAGSLRPGTHVERFMFLVGPDLSNTSLTLQFKREEGVVTWSLRDPAGEIRWAGRLEEGGQFEERREFVPAQGEWRLEVDGRQGTGSYDVCWLGE